MQSSSVHYHKISPSSSTLNGYALYLSILLLAAFVLFTIDVIFLVHKIPHLSMPEGLPVFFSDLHAS